MTPDMDFVMGFRRFDLQTKSSKDFGIDSHFSCGADMTCRIAGSNSQRGCALQQLGLKALLLLLFFYFSYSGASELGLLDGLPKKFEGHLWLGRIMGIAEVFGGLALLRPDGILGGAIVLVVVTVCAIVATLTNHQPVAAAESLLMLNISMAVLHWHRTPKANNL